MISKRRIIMKNCDMCGTEIIDNKCSCGIWMSKEEIQDCPFRKSMEKFDEMKKFTMTGDAPHLGAACVFFRGDYNDCKKVEKYIYEMKNRPYYSDED
jgi:hypothetical protein